MQQRIEDCLKSLGIQNPEPTSPSTNSKPNISKEQNQNLRQSPPMNPISQKPPQDPKSISSNQSKSISKQTSSNQLQRASNPATPKSSPNETDVAQNPEFRLQTNHKVQKGPLLNLHHIFFHWFRWNRLKSGWNCNSI